MWYEALPALVIIGTLCYSYQIASVVLSKAMYGIPYRRQQKECFQRVMFTRDERIAGAGWKTAGLENIKLAGEL